jgi:hypothetical protein
VGPTRRVGARRGGSWHGRSGVAWCVEIGLAGKSWFGLAWHGKAGWVGQGHACRAVKARSAWAGSVGADWVRFGRVWPGRLGTTRHGRVWPGRSGAVGHGRSGPGMAGRLWQVRAWHGRAALASRDMVCPTRGEKMRMSPQYGTARRGCSEAAVEASLGWARPGRQGVFRSGPAWPSRRDVVRSGRGKVWPAWSGQVCLDEARPARCGATRSGTVGRGR